jgi:hypothetical protein
MENELAVRDFLLALADTEAKQEDIRQSLAYVPFFDPLSVFQFMDTKKQSYLTTDTLYEFI